jgi:8-oxo-dGTP pyrophosphatase MutT (NUDIX family)
MQKYKVYINRDLKIISDNWDVFCSKYILIEAAGGVVQNISKQTLMIFRNGKWDLPKGKLEFDENSQECAIREIEEECGVNNLQIVSELQTTYHIYEEKGKSILKRTFWFRMKTNYINKLIPQINEGITKAEWVNKQDIAKRLENSYPNIKDLLSIL